MTLDDKFDSTTRGVRVAQQLCLEIAIRSLNCFRIRRGDMIKTTDMMTDTPITETNAEVYLVLDLSDVGLTDDQFSRLCRDDDDFDIEMSGEGELIIMSPNRPATGRKHLRIIHRLAPWSDED